MTFWPFLHFFAFTVYAAFVVVVLARNHRSRANQVLAIFLTAMAIWCFGKIFTHSISVTRESANFFDNVSAVGWVSFSGLFFIWVQIFTGNRAFFKRRLHYPIILITATFFILQLRGFLLVDHVPQPFGWGNVWANSIVCFVFWAWYPVITLAAVVMLIRFSRQTEDTAMRNQSRVMVVCMIVSLVIGSIIDIGLPMVHIYTIPDLANVVSIILPAGVGYAMVKHQFLVVTPAMAADKIIEQMTDSLILLNARGVVVTANHAVLPLLDFQPSMLRDRHLSAVFLSREAADGFLVEVTAQGAIQNREYTLRRGDGKTVSVSISASTLRDDSGNLAGFMCLARDISAMKSTADLLLQAKTELEREVEARLLELRVAHDQLNKSYRMTRDILEKSPLGIQVANASGAVAYVNPAMCAIAGLDAALFKTVNVFDSPMYVSYGLHEKIRAVMTEGASFTTGPVTVADHFAKKPSVVSYTGIPMADEDGDKTLIFVEDVTEKSRFEAELFRSQKLESIGLLAGGIAHDFNNLLSIILTNISLCKHHASPGDAAFESLSESEKAAKRARDLTQQLLIFSRGGLPVKQVVDVAGMLRETVDFSLRGSSCRPIFQIEPGLWTVELDKGQMHQVIQNLTINAEQAMPDGGAILVSAENRRVRDSDGLPLTPGRYTQISIADHGVGILPEHLQQIFDPYFTTKTTGSGLGLAVAYSVVKKHNGHIAATSTPGEGTCFHIYLPASEKEVSARVKHDRQVRKGQGKILVMDDEELVRRALVRVLTDLGYQVETTADGESAVHLYTQRAKAGDPFDLLILDLIVPGAMGGQKTIEILKARYPAVRAVVSSGYSTDPIMADFKKYGFSDVVVKPYDIRQLSEVVFRSIQRG